MNISRWFIVIPPDGAARVVALHTAAAFKQLLGESNIKTFDTLHLIQTFKNSLITPDDNLIVDLMNQSLVVSCLDFEATHLLSGALSPVSLFTLLLLQKQHVITVHWFYEDFQVITYWHSVLKGYNHFFSIQKGPIPEQCKESNVSWHFLPTAASLPSPDDLSIHPRDIDVAFIGIPSNYRIQALECIANNGFRVAIAGSGWHAYQGILKKYIVSEKWVNEQQAMVIWQNSKIGVNLSVDDPTTNAHVHISPRVFDILISGAICLTEETMLLYETVGSCTIDTFTNMETLIEKTRTIIDNYISYGPKKIINSSYVQTTHTYQNRAKQILLFTT